jgi:hypothetical protein
VATARIRSNSSLRNKRITTNANVNSKHKRTSHASYCVAPARFVKQATGEDFFRANSRENRDLTNIAQCACGDVLNRSSALSKAPEGSAARARRMGSADRSTDSFPVRDTGRAACSQPDGRASDARDRNTKPDDSQSATRARCAFQVASIADTHDRAAARRYCSCNHLRRSRNHRIRSRRTRVMPTAQKP